MKVPSIVDLHINLFIQHAVALYAAEFLLGKNVYSGEDQSASLRLSSSHTYVTNQMRQSVATAKLVCGV